MTNTSYFNFCQSHSQTGSVNNVWWEDDTWISDPSNITHTSIKNLAGGYDGLNAAEKALVRQYPIAAFFIKLNRTTAEEETTFLYGVNGLNDKSDAFRHGFFSAMNFRDCGGIAYLFAAAHESDTPTQLSLEKDMDMFNNNVGMSTASGFSSFISDNALENAIIDNLRNGDLRYLSPLDFVSHPRYSKNNPGCSACTDGIIPGTTVLKPTNL